MVNVLKLMVNSIQLISKIQLVLASSSQKRYANNTATLITDVEASNTLLRLMVLATASSLLQKDMLAIMEMLQPGALLELLTTSMKAECI
jgi:hypothetical protein